MTRRHACPTCHAMHTAPKASNLLSAVVRAVAFTAIEVLAALRIDGWLAFGLWAIAAWNVVLLTLLTIGMAQASTKLGYAEHVEVGLSLQDPTAVVIR